MLINFIVLILITYLGYFFAKFDRFKDETEKALNRYLYYIALPSLIFIKTISIDIKALNLDFLFLNIIPIVSTQLIIFLCYKTGLLTSLFARTLMIISTLGNTVYLGFPVISLIVGESYVSFAALSSSIQNITVFSLGVILINLIEEETQNIKIFEKIIKNPLIISSSTGLLFSILSIKLPFLIIKPLEEIGKTTFGLSLFTLGMSINGIKIAGINFKEIFISFMFKMFILPLISILMIFIFDMNEKSHLVSIINYTMPNAVACYSITYEMKLNHEFTSKSIFFTTILYLIFFFIYNNILFKIF